MQDMPPTAARDVLLLQPQQPNPSRLQRTCKELLLCTHGESFTAPHTHLTPPHTQMDTQLSFVRGNKWETELEVQLRGDRSDRRKGGTYPSLCHGCGGPEHHL